ncbi:hypothetical protein HXX02_00540 [Microbulbifer elongatus]|uniref:Uncharacterized protein n=1 Tax=Microbulbifer elongatus TaxID=86173 RepID=A0ABT1NVK8_9GAMM|nr:hypothetical protein [Microbulbifer elongatus]MCQ3827923.1 hypothetical protein [Microbulbifer elongatus]
MSGRKKNRKHRHGQSQPPHELLSELNSLHELLGSDMEADIPLLDQVASPNGGQKTTPPAPKPQEPRKAGGPQVHAPLAPPPPLEEADLPILFSPIDEELTDEFAPTLSDADRELLRPLQNLPRPEEAPAATLAPADQAPHPADAETSVPPRAEFQPGLFDAPRALDKATPPQENRQDLPAPSESPHASSSGKTQPPQENAPAPATSAGEKTHTTAPALARAASENPFLPPHIRARLTGGRIPKPETTPPAPEPQSHVEPPADDTPETGAEEAPDIRAQLIEQLMAEQLPELEQQLRANITALVYEIYPESGADRD